MFKKSDVKDMYSLTPMQEGMLFHYIMDKEAKTADNAAYFEQMNYEIEGHIDIRLFEQAFNRQVQRYDVLRTVFIYKSSQKPRQVLLKKRDARILYDDISNLGEEEREVYIKEFKRKDREKGFDLTKDMLIRLAVLKRGDRAYEIVWSFHHIIMDGWCTSILIEEMQLIYRNLLQGKDVMLPPTVPYKAYIKWLENRDRETAFDYWRNRLKGVRKTTGIPRRNTGGGNGNKPARRHIRMGHDISEGLTRLAVENNVTLNTVFQTLWGILLQQYNNTDDAVFGAVVSGRPAEINGIETIVGLFINTVPVRINRSKGETVKSILKKTGEQALQSAQYEYLPLAEIQAETALKSNPPDHIVTFENYLVSDRISERIGNYSTGETQGFQLKKIDVFEQTNYDLDVVITPSASLLVSIQYNENVYEEAIINGIERHLIQLAAEIIEKQGKPLEEIELLPEEEKQHLLYELNNTEVEYPSQKTILQLFQEQAKKTPDNMAVIDGDTHWTYLQLEQEVRRTANRIREKELTGSRIVAIHARRSAELTAAQLAVMAVGGVYLPIETQLPLERKMYFLQDSNADLLMESPDTEEPLNWTGKRLTLSRIPGTKENDRKNDKIITTGEPGQIPGPGDPAYIIYTSGSTGRPKGTVIAHRGLVNYITWAARTYLRGRKCDFPLFTSISFDLTLTSIYTPLITGNAIVVYRGDEKEFLIDRVVDDNKVGIVKLTPTHLKILRRRERRIKTGIKCLIVGGEELETSLVSDILRCFGNEIEIYNEYGPTEAVVGCMIYRYRDGKPAGRTVPIGGPADNVHIYILDRNRKPVPLGVAGEMYIAGQGLAEGYLNRQRLTHQRFTENPYEKGKKMYRTGDMARRMTDGNIEFLGREDQQVKIRGYRIELEEIERQMRRHPAIMEAVAAVKTIGIGGNEPEKYICAYYISGEELTASEIREYLSPRLPEYMIPVYYRKIEELPLTTGGKLNRDALPEWDGTQVDNHRYVPPRDDLERKLVEIWKEVLKRDELGIDEDFFQVGGHSLKAILLISRIYKEFKKEVKIKELFNRSTIRNFSALLRETGETTYSVIEPAETMEYYPLSSAQKRLYVLQQMDPRSTVYNLPRVIPVEGTPDIPRLENAFNALQNRHESLRTSFTVIDGQPVQRIHPSVEFSIDRLGEETGEENRRAENIIQQYIRSFNLEQVPLFRAGCLKLENGCHILVMDMHHIISDLLSHAILERDFLAAYDGKPLPALRLQYRDYARWHNGRKETGDHRRQEKYWLKEYEDEIPVLELPLDNPRPVMQSFEGRTLEFVIGKEETAAITRMAAQHGVTRYMQLLALLNVFLAKLGNCEDIVVGTPVAGRRHADLEPIIGMFVNTLALRNKPAKTKTFEIFQEEVKQRTLDGFENQDAQFEDLVEKLPLNRDTGRNPLFDVVFSYHDPEQKQGGNEAATPLREKDRIPGYENRTAKFDLTLYALNAGDTIPCAFEFSTRLFNEETQMQFIGYFKRLVTRILESPGKPISQLEIISDREKTRLLEELNDTAAEYPRNKTVHQLFEEQAEKHPDKVAVIKGAHLTYRRLNREANRLALRLIEKGVGRDMPVGLMMKPDLEMPAAIMGILKAGGAYLPIDPEQPEERKEYILRDSNVTLLVASTEYTGNMQWQGKIVEPDFGGSGNRNEEPTKNPNRENTPDDLLYVIYTSGTTGKPKGVMIEHKNVVRLMVNDRIDFKFDENDIWTMYHSYNFDFSVWEMYGALLYGGTLVLIPRKTARDPQAFLNLLEKERVTVLNQTPSAFYNLIAQDLETPGKKLAVRYVIFGGEALKPAKLKEWKQERPDIKLVNMFGITETTVHVTYKEIGTEEIKHNISNIGKPIPTLTTYVMDETQTLHPVKVPGELHVGGDGVARGYLNRPQLTMEKFVPNPYKTKANHHILYRSGDRVKMLDNGEMEYLGRIDHQVQVRGYRVELGEIESRLLKYPGVQELEVIAREDTDGEKTIIAYIVSSEKLDTTDIRTFLSQKLPEYMVPHYVMQIDGMPLTPNGKVDRSALPEPTGAIGDHYKAPANETEAEVADIWKEVMGIERIGMTDNYFHMGGDSIVAIRLISMINKKMQADLRIEDIYMYQTVEALAAQIQKGEKSRRDKLAKKVLRDIRRKEDDIRKQYGITDEVERIYPINDVQKAMLYYYRKDSEQAIYHDQAVFQVRYGNFDRERMEKAFTLLCRKHPVLRSAILLEELVQTVTKTLQPPVRVIDISAMEPVRQEEYIAQHMEQSRTNPFDVSKPPLWRMTFFKVGNENTAVLWEFHHVILDGWSSASFLTELNNLYLRLKNEPAAEPAPLKNTYESFVVEQELEKRTSRENNDTKHYWKEQLEDYKRLDFPAPTAEQNFRLERLDGRLGQQLRKRLETVAERNTTHLKHICFAAYVYMLSMLTYDNDLVVGLVGNTRPGIEDGEKLLGCFLNTVPVRVIVPPETTWTDYIRFIDQKLVQLKKHEKLSLLDIKEIIGEQTREGNPLLDAIFNFIDFHAYDRMEMDNPSGNGDREERKLKLDSYEKTNTRFDFRIIARGKGFYYSLSYSTEIIDEETALRLCENYKRILACIVEEPGEQMQPVTVMSQEERQKITREFNRTRLEYPSHRMLHHLLRDRATTKPDAVALVCDEQQVTYRQLDEASGRIARALTEKGISAGNETIDIAAIMMEPSIHMMEAIYGVLKAGGAYLPVEPNYPAERIRYMMKDSNTRMLLVTPATLKAAQQIGIKSIETVDVINISRESQNIDRKDVPVPSTGQRKKETPGNPAYVVYTSGSTGRPKGVVVEHRNVVNFITGMAEKIDFDEKKAILALTTISFDIFVLETILPLSRGMRVIVASGAQRDEPQRLNRLMLEKHVELIQVTPSRLKLLVMSSRENCRFLANIRDIMVGGEAFPRSLLKRLQTFPGFKGRIINVYGPAETTVWSTQKELTRQENVTIGKPIANTRIYILDRDRRLMPVGAAGELCIGGDGVARGYLNRPELTARQFVRLNGALKNIGNGNAPGSSNSEIIYRTGDLARWLPDGNIEFIDRVDHQLKIRGYRIEPGEIENRLKNHRDILDTVVAAGESNDGTKYLCAYIVSTREFEVSELRENLARELPEYMIPAYFVRLQALPLTPNGKINRSALPAPGITAGKEYTPPKGKLQQELTGLWAEVLGIERDVIGADTGFFQVGGHSLNATILTAKIQKKYNVNVPLAQFFKAPTIARLAQTIRDADPVRYSTVAPVEEKEYYPLSSAQRRLYILQQMEIGTTVYNISMINRLEGELDRQKIRNAADKLMQRHESLRTTFHVVNDEPVQRIQGLKQIEIEYYELEGNHSREERSESATKTAQRFVRAFRLNEAPLIRIGVIKQDEKEHILMVDMHHIISDRASMQQLVKEFLALYAGKSIPTLTARYRDYVHWYRQRMNTSDIKRQETYWLNRFGGEVPRLEMPTDYPRPTKMDFEGGCVPFIIEPEKARQIKKQAAQAGVTHYAYILAVYNVFIHKYSGQEDIVVGTPAYGRNHDDLRQIVGMFVNMLPMRNQPHADKSFLRFLGEVADNSVDAFDNQDYQFEELIWKLGIPNEPGRHPLIDTELNYHVRENEKKETGEKNDRTTGLEIKAYENGKTTAQFDLYLDAVEAPGGIYLTMNYRSRLFKAETVRRMTGHFMNILEDVLENPEKKITGINMLKDTERRQLQQRANRNSGRINEKAIRENNYKEAGQDAGDGIYTESQSIEADFDF